jgi:putative endonuclease
LSSLASVGREALKRRPGTQVPELLDPAEDSRYNLYVHEHLYFVYILASGRNGTLYIGVTNDVMRRTWEHKSDLIEGFTRKYGVHILVWYETHNDINEAIIREKKLKHWKRAWKIELIEQQNSGWNDLYDRLIGEIVLPDAPGSPFPRTNAER